MPNGWRVSGAKRKCSRLNHPHIAQIYGFENGDGASALVMELVEGKEAEDIKVRPDGTVMVLDVGLAKALAPGKRKPADGRRRIPRPKTQDPRPQTPDSRLNPQDLVTVSLRRVHAARRLPGGAKMAHRRAHASAHVGGSGRGGHAGGACGRGASGVI
jgi:hypothetical protein